MIIMKKAALIKFTKIMIFCNVNFSSSVKIHTKKIYIFRKRNNFKNLFSNRVRTLKPYKPISTISKMNKCLKNWLWTTNINMRF